MNKQERIIVTVAALVLILGFVFVMRAVNTPPGGQIEPVAAPTAGEALPESAPAVVEELPAGDGIDVQSYAGRVLPFCGLHGEFKIYSRANDRTDTGERIGPCSSMRGNLEQYGWPSFRVIEGGATDEWLAVEQKTDVSGIDLPATEVRYVRREDVGTPSMIVDGDKRWPLELGWATLSTNGFLAGYEGWCEHRDRPLKVKNLPKNYRIETLVAERGEDDCST